MAKRSKHFNGLSRGLEKSPSSFEGHRRRTNVYDAVAGRVTRDGLIGKRVAPKASTQPLRPDEVLFKQAKAPIRYEETDYYHAHTATAVQQQLPNGDLLSAIHAYISKLYSRTAQPGYDRNWKCMDETALIACGILLEETAREVLGATGDLALTEAADMEEDMQANGPFEQVHDTSTRRDAATGDDSVSSQQPDSTSSDDDSRYTTDESD